MNCDEEANADGEDGDEIVMNHVRLKSCKQKADGKCRGIRLTYQGVGV